MAERTIWGIHMAREHGSAPIERGYVALGWNDVGDLSAIPPNREAFKAAYAATYPDASAGNVAVSAGVLYRFAHEVKLGDIVVYPSKTDRMVNIGVVTGRYRVDPDMPDESQNARAVEWRRHLPRADFPQPALNEIGSALTLFRVTTNADVFLAALDGGTFEAPEADEVVAEHAAEQARESTEDFIVKRLKSGQTPYQFEHFVAHLLRRMGYHARVTQASGDGGVDIIAHKDELGFEPPIIKVQCKQVLTNIGRPEVQQLHGAVERGEHGLFVTLGGFSPDARTFERTKPNLRLIDGPALIELIYRHYEQFEPRYQMLLPLRRQYVPAPVVSASD